MTKKQNYIKEVKEYQEKLTNETPDKMPASDPSLGKSSRELESMPAPYLIIDVQKLGE